MEIRYIKSAARLLDRNCVNRKGLDLLKEVLWVSVGQRVAELLAVKVGGQKRFRRSPWFKPNLSGPSSRIFSNLQL